MPLDLIFFQVETEASHLTGKRLLQLGTCLTCKDVRVINPPAAHGFPIDLGGEVPDITCDVLWNGKKIEISLLPSPIPLKGTFGGQGGGQNLQHPGRMYRRIGE